MHVQLVRFFFLSSQIGHYTTVFFNNLLLIFFVNLVNHRSFSSLSCHHWSLSLSSFHQLSSDDGSITWAPTASPELRRGRLLLMSFSSLSFHHRSLSLSLFHHLSSDDGSISWAPTTVPSAELRQRFHYLRFDACPITWAPTTAVLSHGKYMLCITDKKISFFNLNLFSNSWIFSRLLA